MKQYNVTGMSCAACQTRVEKAVSAVEGVESCAVSLLTNSMGVEGNANPDAVIKAIEDAGYGASLKQGSGNAGGGAGTASGAAGGISSGSDSLKDTETPKMKKRLVASLILLAPLLYFSMGHMLWNWPLPPFFNGNHVAMGLYQLLLSAFIMVINQKFFVSGFKGLIHKAPNMDTLVALGATAAFGYSVFALFGMTGAVISGNEELVKYYMNQFYFESAATILTLITVGKMLEAKSKGKTTNALKSLMNLAPKTAVLLIDGEEKTVAIDEVKAGDKFVVRPGDSIPVDGIVLEGESAVNESAITGESVPVEKQEGDKVTSATINTSGYMVCQATRVGEDTTLAGIIRMVSDAAATKAPIAKIADKVSGVFVPVVIAIASVTLVVWLSVGQNFGYAIARAVSVLVISCPCALGLATPVAIMVGSGVGAKSGILFKTAASLEQAGKTKIIALDKTGTITTGVMKVTDVLPADETNEADEANAAEVASLKELLSVAYSLEAKSEHPISKAIVEYAKANTADNSVVLKETTDFEALSGKGLRAKLGNDEVSAGNSEYITELLGETGGIKDIHKKQIENLASQGKTPVLFAKNKKLLGIIAVADTIKEDSAQAISALKEMGIHTVMLTGDNEITARTIGMQAGVDEIIANVKPDGKEAVIKQLMQNGKVTMVGDGINDAPALTRADLGIAIGAGTDIAIDAADVVLMKNSIMDVVAAIRISRATLKNIHENLFWAFIYNVIGIPLAAGCYVAVFGWELNPMFGAAAMGLSSFCVVSNALRLNFIKAYRAQKRLSGGKKGNGSKNPATESGSELSGSGLSIENTALSDGGKQMKITVKGMMCGHCEAHVKKALEAIDGITSVTASHEENLVTIENSKPVDESLIKSAVEEAGYEYAGIVG